MFSVSRIVSIHFGMRDDDDDESEHLWWKIRNTKKKFLLMSMSHSRTRSLDCECFPQRK